MACQWDKDECKEWEWISFKGTPYKEDSMRTALHEKFTQNPILTVMLMSTRDAILREHTENDCYWGDGGGEGKRGKNRLGVRLMELRAAFNISISINMYSMLSRNTTSLDTITLLSQPIKVLLDFLHFSQNTVILVI